MKTSSIISLSFFLMLLSVNNINGMSLQMDSLQIKADKVLNMAEDLIKKGFTAGDGYGEIWIRDFNTFINVSSKVNDKAVVRKHLLTFLKFQQSDGRILDGYIPATNTSVGYNYYKSALAPEYLGHKNTVETDQESSLIQAVSKYILSTGDKSILKDSIAGNTVQHQLERSLKFLLTKRFESKYGLIWGATTADWGDIQPEHNWGVELNDDTHRAIDIYDNAMFAIAIKNYLAFADVTSKERKYWSNVSANLKKNVRKYLWDKQGQKFRPHIYLNGSPFPKTFDEEEIYYHGGTTIAIEADFLTAKEVKDAYTKMQQNVISAKASTIGLTLYPVYPEGTFKNTGMSPYSYQNGGDWTWFGGRMISELIRYGYMEEAKTALAPMLERVIKNNGFYEWYTPDNQPKGSSSFRGEAGVLWTAIMQLKANSANHK
jgi:glycogen debranching enzyme